MRSIRALLLLAVMCCTGLAHAAGPSGASGGWTVRDGQLFDPSGQRFVVFGDNWHGYDGWYNDEGKPSHKPEGIWANRKIGDIARQMVDELGYNTIRVPVSMVMLLEDPPAAADRQISEANAKYRGLSAQQSLVLFLKDLTDAGLYVLPEIHTTKVGQNAGAPRDYGYSDDDLLKAHQTLLRITQALGDKVLAQGFFNEPYGGALHSGSAVDPGQWDYRSAASRIGKVITAEGRLFALDCVSDAWPRDSRGKPDPNGPHDNMGWGENCYGQARWPVDVPKSKLLVMPHFYFESNAGVNQTSVEHWMDLLGAQAPEGSVVDQGECVVVGEWSYAPEAGDSAASLDRFLQFAQKAKLCGALRWGVSPNQHLKEHGLFNDDWTTIREPARSSLLRMRKVLLGD